MSIARDGFVMSDLLTAEQSTVPAVSTWDGAEKLLFNTTIDAGRQTERVDRLEETESDFLFKQHTYIPGWWGIKMDRDIQLASVPKNGGQIAFSFIAGESKKYYRE